MHKMFVPLDNAKSFRFEGEMISEALGSADRFDLPDEDNADPWAELRLYSTVDGQYVCEQVRCENWKGGHERHKVTICDSKNKIKDFFGTSWLARELYTDADIFDAGDAD